MAYLIHYGVPRKSGRYPYGSGKNPRAAIKNGTAIGRAFRKSKASRLAEESEYAAGNKRKVTINQQWKDGEITKDERNAALKREKQVIDKNVRARRKEARDFIDSYSVNDQKEFLKNLEAKNREDISNYGFHKAMRIGKNILTGTAATAALATLPLAGATAAPLITAGMTTMAALSSIPIRKTQEKNWRKNAMVAN